MEFDEVAVCGLKTPVHRFYLATSSVDGTVKLWDLRKLVNFRTLTFEDSSPSNPTHVNSVAFDVSGSYIALAADNVKYLPFDGFCSINMDSFGALTPLLADATP